LKILLEKPTTTQILSSTGVHKPRRRKSTARGVTALIVFALIAAGSAAVIYDPTLLDRFRLPGGSDEATSVQQSAAMSGTFDFDLSDLIEDDSVSATNSTPEAAIQTRSADKNTADATTSARSNENIARAFTPDQTPPKQVVEKKEAVSVKPTKPRARIGYLKIEALPSAEIYIDNVYKGDTPPAMSVELAAGEHKVECRNPRYETYSEVLRIINGELSRRNVTLRKLKGGISFATQEGAEIYIDGRLIGVTPLRKPMELDAGPHMVTLKKAGFFTWSSEVTVESNKTLPIRITLSPRY
jgi:hypothetical protein